MAGLWWSNVRSAQGHVKSRLRANWRLPIRRTDRQFDQIGEPGRLLGRRPTKLWAASTSLVTDFSHNFASDLPPSASSYPASWPVVWIEQATTAET
jgi:hypothetical protein